jgi:hypothetical protein
MLKVVYRTFVATALLTLALACAASAATPELPKEPTGLPPRAYVAGTYDGSTLRLYVNGRVVATKAVHGTPDSNQNPVEIGAYAGQGVWQGTIDEVAIYRDALTPAEISRRYEVGVGEVHENYARLVEHTKGLAAYYPLDDTKGTRAHSRWKGPVGAYEAPVHLGAVGLITGDKDTGIALDGKKGSVSVPEAGSHDPG